MFGLDLSTFVQLIFWLILACFAGLAFCIYKLGKAPAAPAGTWQAQAQAAIAARDIHQADDVYKASPIYADVKHIKELLAQAAAKAKTDATAVVGKVQADLSPVPAPVGIPASTAGEGIEKYAVRVGVDPASMRLVSTLHPGDTWEVLADRIKNPSKYFTDADRDTVAAATAANA